jgi:glycosyltransferase involved in cell wall biosynthesis
MTNYNTACHIAVVVPTLGKRMGYLQECLESLRNHNHIYIVVIGPETLEPILIEQSLPFDVFLAETQEDSLPESINRAIGEIPLEIQFVTWLGDDDRVIARGYHELAEQLRVNPEVVCAFGDCFYINSEGKRLWLNKPGRIAARFVGFLPQRISQPASLIRRSAWNEINGLKSYLRLAFDYDLYIRLNQIGKFSYTSAPVAEYRWHSDALSVKSRKTSVTEASVARCRNRSTISNIALFPFEMIIIAATFSFAFFVGMRREISQRS